MWSNLMIESKGKEMGEASVKEQSNTKNQCTTAKAITVLVKAFEITLWMLLTILFVLFCLIAFYIYA